MQNLGKFWENVNIVQVVQNFLEDYILVIGHMTWSHLLFAWVRECPPWSSIVVATVTVHQFFCILHSCQLYFLREEFCNG